MAGGLWRGAVWSSANPEAIDIYGRTWQTIGPVSKRVSSPQVVTAGSIPIPAGAQDVMLTRATPELCQLHGLSFPYSPLSQADL